MIKLYDNEIPYNHADPDGKPEVTAYLTDTWYKLPAVIVLPGGGYSQHAAHEAEPIAKFYQDSGFHAFVLKYRLLPNLYPAALCDLQRLIKYLRANGDALKVDAQKIFVIGFSAGGHLAAMSAVAQDVCVLGDDLDGQNHRPNGVLLGYPAVNAAHGCVKRLCGNQEELFDKLSIDKQITADTPRMFIWHTSDDSVVDVRQSLALTEALRQQNIPFEMHIFPSGQHGLGLGKLHTDIRKWADLSVEWILHNF